MEELEESIIDQIRLFKPIKPARFSRPNRFDSFDDRLETLDNVYSLYINNQFRLFFMSYSKSINKQTGRSGSLFRENFKRKEIGLLQYLQQVVIYIHRNPKHHGLIDDFTFYPWSSYRKIMKEKRSKLKKKQVLEWFDSIENYQYVHKNAAEDWEEASLLGL